MDSVTQFLLGASFSAILLGPKHGMKAALIGGVVATLPDLDTFLPHENLIEAVTRHRGFSHSVIVQTAVSPLVAGVIKYALPKQRFDFKLLLFTVWICLITHSLLDVLTTYGTQIFWPLEVGPPAAFPSVFIIDPIYTLLLLFGVLSFLFVIRRDTARAVRYVRSFLIIATAYLGLGMVGHMVVKSRAEAHPLLAGKKIHVQPTPFNILYWQVLAVDDEHYYTSATSVLRGCALLDVKKFPRRFKPLNSSLNLPDFVKRFEWFTDGFYSYASHGDEIEIFDLRIGFSPVFPFSFLIATKAKAGYRLIAPIRNRGKASRRLEQLSEIYSQAAIEPKGCW